MIATDWSLVVTSVTAIAAVLIAAAVPATGYIRRPKLQITERDARRHSQVESDGLGYLRLVVENAPRRRAAHGTRVIVEGYRRQGDSERELRSLAHPLLGWPSAVEAMTEATVAAVSVYSGADRPIDFGHFIRARRSPEGRLQRGAAGNIAHTASGDPDATWHLILGLHNLSINDDRDKLPPGRWIVRLLVGADDGDASRCDVHIAWDESVGSSELVLEQALERLAIESV
jgi:hypothetical protein